MCGVNEAMMAFKIVGAVSEHNAKKQTANQQAAANQQAIESANAAYLTDITNIESDRGKAAAEKSLEEFKVKMQRKAATAQALNLGFGNPTSVVQNIGYTADLDYNEITTQFLGDMEILNNQGDQAYANMQRTYNSLEPVTQPSVLGLGLEIAAAGGGYLNKPQSERIYFKDYGRQTDKV